MIKKSLIQETLGSEYSYQGFQNFISNFLKDIEIKTEWRNEAIWKEFTKNISAYYKLGDYVDDNGSELLVLAVELKKGSTVERARSLQRNFISKMIDNSTYNGALVAFYTPGEVNWRLSFIRLDYKLTESGIELDLTPAKRFSYLVGKNEPTHTAQKRLFKIIEDDSKKPTIEEIEEAFSVEKVTSEFFEQYKEKYIQLKEFLEKSDDFISETKKNGLILNKFSEQFAKKLMGQIVFLYFVQKKGWMGVTLLPDNKNLKPAQFEKLKEDLTLTQIDVLGKVFPYGSEKNSHYMDLKIFRELSEQEVKDFSDIFIKSEFSKPWGTGDKQFIRGLFEFCENSTDLNFFDAYLEPLFYEALNIERKNSYYHRFNCKIPFLNGGLFEPLENYDWRNSKFNLPNEIFSNKNTKGENADGILDIFDRYNFTINENEPLETEIAVDPEMLGKVFENLLDITDRKSKGAFYTPREIVHFMCQESLTNYLSNKVNVPYEDIKQFILYGELMRDQDNKKMEGSNTDFVIPQSVYKNIIEIDNALRDVKIADPAVGSGAFPIGLLNEIVSARSNITEYIFKLMRQQDKFSIGDINYIKEKRSLYNLKMFTIQNSIYAVDIEESAVDITKLRLWLSLVVDQKLNNNEDPHPLPNLEFNIKAGNSLIDEYEGIKLFDKKLLEINKINKEIEDVQIKMLLDSDELLSEMFRMQRQYFHEYDINRKNNLKMEIERLQDLLISQKINEQGEGTAIKKYKKARELESKPFFIWELEFAQIFKENGGFDIVIGNPPYINFQSINKELGNLYKKMGFKVYISNGDIYTLFYEKGIEILNESGNLCYITSNKWMKTAYGKKLRNYLIEYTHPTLLIDLGSGIFSNATVDTNILLLNKNKTKQKFRALKINSSLVNLFQLEYSLDTIDLKKDELWTIQNKTEIQIMNKIESKGIKLKDWYVRIKRGITTGNNNVYIIDSKIRDKLVTMDPSSSELIMPMVRGRDISKYKIRYAKLYIVLVHNGYIDANGNNIPPINIEKYPAIYEYLKANEEELSNRTDQGTVSSFCW